MGKMPGHFHTPSGDVPGTCDRPWASPWQGQGGGPVWAGSPAGWGSVSAQPTMPTRLASLFLPHIREFQLKFHLESRSHSCRQKETLATTDQFQCLYEKKKIEAQKGKSYAYINKAN